MNPILNLNFLKVTADGERASSQAVVAPKKPCLDAPKLARKIPISIEEQALMDYLFQTGSIAVQEKQGLGAILPPLQPKRASTPPSINPIIQQFEMAQTQNGDFLNGEVESLEELL